MKTFRVRIKPNKKQEEFFLEQCRLNRWLYNDLLALFKSGAKTPFTYIPSRRELSSWSHFSLGKIISPLRKRGEKYHELLSDAANITTKDLSVVISETFKKYKRGEKVDLKFKNYRENNSFSFSSLNTKILSGISMGYLGLPSPNVNGKRVKYGKIKILDRGNFHLDINGKIKQIKIIKDGKHWFACFVIKDQIEYRNSKLGAIGVDLGVTKPLYLSDGNSYNQPKEDLKYWENRKKFYSRKLAKQHKGSKRREKTKLHLQRCHKKVSDIRKNWQHNVSHELTLNNNTIVLEDLEVKNMTKSAKGDEENHGKNVKAKSGLNREILNVGFYGLKNKLMYKSEWRGGNLILVDPKYTSQTCSECGYKDKGNRKTQSNFKCISCGHEENADFNASKNILKKGLTITSK